MAHPVLMLARLQGGETKGPGSFFLSNHGG